ncbi:MFS transporter [Paenibacillus sp. GSMTC-2017]|uniref:MFS transporter n=1 Tax=Paenibacillus sp. GSMTC-2017 TaxID=2794350 RepID=UPI0018D8BAAB|nr:MFS transporter [Paenibacillus sp. GSMTC-2017]MBH5318212.1 MFS transporter [Paenibacillus sp. GSMTC-2017]
MNAPDNIGDIRSATAKSETWALRSFSFAAFSTHALVISFLPLFFMTKGFSESQIGILYSTGLFVSIFANIITGLASDKYRTIRKILILLLFGQLAMISLLMPSDNFIVICTIMTAFYFFQTPINPLSDSLIMLSSEHTGTPYALVRIFGSLGFALSAYGFGLLLKVIGSEWTLAIILFTIVITIILAFVIKDYQGKTRKMEFSGFFNILGKRNVLIFFLLILLISIAHRMYESFLAVTLRQLGASDSLIGLALLISAVSEIPILFLLGKYGHRFKELPLLIFASLMYGLRLWFLSEIDDPNLVVVTQLMHSVSFGIYFSTALRYISRLIPDEFRASGQAVYTVVWTGLAGIISGVLGGFIYESFGRVVYYQTATIIAGVAAIGFFLYQFSRSNK